MPVAPTQTRLRRRQFLLRTALTFGALSIRMPLARAASPKGTAAIEIPPELRYVRFPLPDEANAYVDWGKAKATWVPPEEPVKSILPNTWRVGAKPLSDDERHALSVWLKANQGALRCAEESLRKPKAQWPAYDVLTSDPALPIVLGLARARIAEAYQLAHDWDFATAAESLVGTARLGQLAANGEGVLIDYLVAVRSRDLTEEAAQKLALESEAPEAALQQLLQGLPTLDGERETFVRTLRVEFTDCAAKTTDPVKFSQMLTEAYQKSLELSLFFLPEELQRAWVVFLDPQLVAGHPGPVGPDAVLARDDREFPTPPPKREKFVAGTGTRIRGDKRETPPGFPRRRQTGPRRGREGIPAADQGRGRTRPPRL
jgi:hypothetical protein